MPVGGRAKACVGKRREGQGSLGESVGVVPVRTPASEPAPAPPFAPVPVTHPPAPSLAAWADMREAERELNAPPVHPLLSGAVPLLPEHASTTVARISNITPQNGVVLHSPASRRVLQPRDIVLDPGAIYSMISEDLLKELGLTTTPSGFALMAGEQVSPLERVPSWFTITVCKGTEHQVDVDVRNMRVLPGASWFGMLIGIDLHTRMGLVPWHAGEELYFSSGHAHKHKLPIECIRGSRPQSDSQPVVARVRTTGADLLREQRCQLRMEAAELEGWKAALTAAPGEVTAHMGAPGAGHARVAVVLPSTQAVPARSQGKGGQHAHGTGTGACMSPTRLGGARGHKGKGARACARPGAGHSRLHGDAGVVGLAGGAPKGGGTGKGAVVAGGVPSRKGVGAQR